MHVISKESLWTKIERSSKNSSCHLFKCWLLRNNIALSCETLVMLCIIFGTLRTILTQFRLQVEIWQFFRTDNTALPIKVRLSLWTLSHCWILLNVFVVDVYPFILCTTWKYQIRSCLRICLVICLCIPTLV